MKGSRLAEMAVTVVEATQRKLPPAIRPLALAVPVHYDAAPPPSLLDQGFERDILGLFTGSPYGTELSHDQPAPPEILLYLDNLWDLAEGDDTIFREEVRLTYVHELGHYLGWDEDELTARGLD